MVRCRQMSMVWLLVTVVLAAGLAGSIFTAAAQVWPRIVVDSTPVIIPLPPRITQGHLVAPMRGLLEALGYEVGWEESTQEAVARKEGSVLRARVGAGMVRVNDMPVALPLAVGVTQGTMVVPVRAVLEALGAGLRWDEQSQTLSVHVAPGAPGAGITQDQAIAKAREYLQGLGHYPQQVTGTSAERALVPANRYWEALATGGEIATDAPRRECWVVEIRYSGLNPDSWKHVYVDVNSGEVVGGQQSR